MKHTVRTLTYLSVYALVIRCILFLLTNEATPNHYTISEWNTTLESAKQHSFHKNYFQTCFHNNRKPLIQRYKQCKHFQNANTAYNNNTLHEDYFYHYPTTAAQLLESTPQQPHRKPKVGSNHQVQRPNRALQFTCNRPRWTTTTTLQPKTKKPTTIRHTAQNQGALQLSQAATAAASRKARNNIEIDTPRQKEEELRGTTGQHLKINQASKTEGTAQENLTNSKPRDASGAEIHRKNNRRSCTSPNNKRKSQNNIISNKGARITNGNPEGEKHQR
jgi:hypothetical protein